VHKGDTVTIHFYNTAHEPGDRTHLLCNLHTKWIMILLVDRIRTFSFKADTVGGFTYFCRYDLPSMIGHLEVLPYNIKKRVSVFAY
jgi:plastocyanin